MHGILKIANCKFSRTVNKKGTFWKISMHSSSFCSNAFSTFDNICYMTGKLNSDSLLRVRRSSRSVNKPNQFQGDGACGSGRTCHSRHRHSCVTCHASDCWLQTSESKHGVRSVQSHQHDVEGLKFITSSNRSWFMFNYPLIFVSEKGPNLHQSVCDCFKLCQVCAAKN